MINPLTQTVGGCCWYIHLLNHVVKGTLNWRLLFQIDTGPQTGMNWANSGMVYYWIERDAIKTRQFDRVWAMLQSKLRDSPAGYVDDAAVIAFVLRQAKVDRDKFIAWEAEQKTGEPIH